VSEPPLLSILVLRGHLFACLFIYIATPQMGGVVSSTADILAILGGVTTLVLGMFGAIRLSRCQHVRCCWGCIDLVNKPLASGAPPASGASSAAVKNGGQASQTQSLSLPVRPPSGSEGPPSLRASDSESDLAAVAVI
jgi:hypothetical protein